MNQWYAVPTPVREMYKKRASLFTDAFSMEKFEFSEELDRFTLENAGFYQFVFSQKGVYDHRTKLFGSGQLFPFLLSFFSVKLSR